MSIRQEAVVYESVLHAQTLVRQPMSRAEFDALPDLVRAEYVDGVALMSPPATDRHNYVADELRGLLRAALPGLKPVRECGLALPSGRLRIPDIAVVADLDDEEWSTATPVLVVEILSTSTRNEDLLRKTGDYMHAGIGQYWIVDRDARTLTTLRNTTEEWEIALELTAERPRGEIAVGEHGVVPLDLDQILAT